VKDQRIAEIFTLLTRVKLTPEEAQAFFELRDEFIRLRNIAFKESFSTHLTHLLKQQTGQNPLVGVGDPKRSLKRPVAYVKGTEVSASLREHGSAIEGFHKALGRDSTPGELENWLARMVASFEVLCDIFGVPVETEDEDEGDEPLLC
jgi:hypothetical protein